MRPRVTRSVGFPFRKTRVPIVAAAAMLAVLAPNASWATIATPAGQSAARSPAATPRPVPPGLTALSVPTVTPGKRAAVAAQLGVRAGTSAGGAQLVAHLRKPLTHRFAMVGVTWDDGTAATGTTITVRARTAGTWSAWTPLAIEPSEGPAAGQDRVTRSGTAPAWVGAAIGVEVAVYAPGGQVPQHLEVDAIDPGKSAYDSSATSSASAASSAKGAAGPDAGTFPSMPTVVTRKQWGADPSLGDRCWQPRLGDTFTMVFIHHTAGSNHYSRSQSPAVVRGVYAYHTQARGWCDIGYNFLVDRYGTIYEGRRGGIRLPVRGAHAGDYNVDTTGISLMGDFTKASPTRAMKHSLVQLVAWRMGTAYHGAYGRPTVNGKVLSRISGHRDAMSTDCPGQQVYDWLPTLRQRVATRLGGYESPIQTRWRAIGGPKSRLGLVSIGEQGENHGHHTAFQTGRMYDSKKGGLHTLYRSPVLKKYLQLGETNSRLGYPASNLHSIVGGTGSSATFLGGRIFSSPPAGSTVLIRGAILKRYLATGSAAGPLGFPTVPVHNTKIGSMARFQHGTIAWDASRHRIVVNHS
jgi:uncharacterized protein with LGFP repeats